MSVLFSDEFHYSRSSQVFHQTVALGLIVAFVAALKVNVGLPPTMIVGGSAMAGFFCWRMTNLRRPIQPQRVAILFLLTTAALHVHMLEEHDCLFGPSMSRLFEIAFPTSRFTAIFVFALPTLYYLTAIGLLLRLPLAAFMAWFIFIGPGIAEFTHFLFPLIRPALEPTNPAAITAVINGETITDMPNHYYFLTGRYYFPGLYTAILPMIPGGYSVWWLLREGRRLKNNAPATP